MNNNYLHFKDNEIYLYKDFDGEDITIYTGERFDTITKQKRNDILSRPFKNGFLLVPSTSKKKKQMIKEHKKYISMIEEIKTITDDKINMFRTGTFSNTSLSLFTELNKIKSTKIEQYEFKYLNNGGGVRYAKKGYEGEAFKYDINSYYPSIMLSKYVRFPNVEGTLTDITSEEIEHKRYVKFGIYNVKIYCDDDVKFTTIKSNMYSHYEINYAKKLNLKIEVLGQALLWDKEQTVTFHSVFNKYVNFLYKYKTAHKKIKLILNALWGSLVSKRGGVCTFKIKFEEVDKKKHDIIRITPIGDDFMYCNITVKNDVKFYKTSYARLNSFLLGYARTEMHKTFLKIGYDNVLWSHTDSVITSIPIHNKIKISNAIGDWKYEGCADNCNVYNKNLCDGDFN